MEALEVGDGRGGHAGRVAFDLREVGFAGGVGEGHGPRFAVDARLEGGRGEHVAVGRFLEFKPRRRGLGDDAEALGLRERRPGGVGDAHDAFGEHLQFEDAGVGFEGRPVGVRLGREHRRGRQRRRRQQHRHSHRAAQSH